MVEGPTPLPKRRYVRGDGLGQRGGLSKEQIKENVKFQMDDLGFPLNPIKYIPLFFSNPKLSFNGRILFILFFSGSVISVTCLSLLPFWYAIATIFSLSTPSIFGFQGLKLVAYSILLYAIFAFPFMLLGFYFWTLEISDKLNSKDISENTDKLKLKIEMMKSKGIDTTDLEKILEQVSESSDK